MEVAKVVLFLVGGGLVLSWGANLFVQSASHISRRFGISPVIIGLTVVAFGTSAPELAVNVLASLQGNPDIAMGNVVGSNIFNVAFILGICTIISPLFVSSQLIRIDIPIMVFSSGALWFMAKNNSIGRVEGLFLFAGIIFYNFLQVRLAVKGKNADQEFEKEFADPGNPLKDGFILVGGLVLLVAGAKYFVDGAVIGARLLGWSEAVIGLTIIAVGTSLPEVATSVAATVKGERDIAIGNVVGSNIFNILGVIGLSSLISPNGLPVNEHMARIDASYMVALAFFCLPFTIWRKQLDRPLGFIYFTSWIGYTWYLISQS
ncbi:MAG: calcium/sodium antiporter [Bacteriovoracia bacterium]